MKKTRKSFKIISVIISCFCFMFAASACGGQLQKQPEVVLFDSGTPLTEGNNADAEDIAAVCRDVFAEIAAEDTVRDLEVMQKIVGRLGENGYAAVDSGNQVDMTNAELVLDFCRAVDAGEQAELTIVEVISAERLPVADVNIDQKAAMPAGIRKYDFHTENGRVDIVREYYSLDQYGNPVSRDTVSYPADLWQYTENGYLVFSGSYYAEDYYIISLMDEAEHAALRVAPLDAECRELYRKYIQPVGYGDNNLFLVNWTEEDTAGLDFYDLFDVFYPMVYRKAVPYTASENPGVGFVYRIAESEFEGVVGTYLGVAPEALRSETAYFAEDKSYEYRPRGFYEAGSSNMPYPEVADYLENADGTITLTVNAVFAYEGTSCAFTHEVVIRLLENDGFQYVSNQIIDGDIDGDIDAWWYTKRLTAQEWEDVYAGHGSGGTGAADDPSADDESLWYLPQADECLLTEAETDELEDAAMAAAEHVGNLYQNVEIEAGASYASNVVDFSEAQCREVVSLLGKAGFVSVADNANMQNYEAFEDFYDAYSQRRDAMVTVYDVQRDGLIGALTFVYRNVGQKDKVQVYYIGIGWQEGGKPRIKNTLVSDVAEMQMTEKGYFIYSYEEQLVHSDESQYFRVRPLSDKCRELTRKYVEGLSFVNYNAFATDWDSGNVEEILTPCMFEDIYRIDTGTNLKVENDRIPAADYERVMTTYFPISKKKLRAKCGYDAESDSYPYEMIFAVAHAPFGEVVDYSVNTAAGTTSQTITLFVEGVWIDYHSDCAFTSEILVQPFADGTFRYLSNRISSENDDFLRLYMDGGTP